MLLKMWHIVLYGGLLVLVAVTLLVGYVASSMIYEVF